AAFTPTFQATIPDILPDEREYTRALSLSRLAYDLESVISPMLAALLLTVVSFHSLFAGTVVGFLVSAAMVGSVILPVAIRGPKRSIYERTTKGMRIFLRTPRLRGLLALNLTVAAASAMVIVNTVVLVQSQFGLAQSSTAMALMAFGAGSMIVALALPRLLERLDDRKAMLAGGAVLVVGLMLGAFVNNYWSLVALWLVLGAGYSLAQTPSGRILRRSSTSQDRPALFAAQFALSHACWLITYPLAGWLGASVSLTASFIGLTLVAAIAWLLSKQIWRPEYDDEVVAHAHDDLPEDHPHVVEGKAHAHTFVIDEHHHKWPGR
ncbi:MFS transporter, partial [Pseudomonas sp. NPDC089554]|uniref:MFS transporter n=1 Tax=Pseudomonas sp. NPDC089554 TaxID=3390653 RepID=UPI003D04D5E6